MQMLAYGNKVMGVENRNNYFLNRDFTYLSNLKMLDTHNILMKNYNRII